MLPDRAVMTQMTNDTVVRRIMMAYEIARQATEKPLPKNASEAQDPLDDKDLTQHPTIIEGEMLEDIRQTRYPSTRAILRRSCHPAQKFQPEVSDPNRATSTLRATTITKTLSAICWQPRRYYSGTTQRQETTRPRTTRLMEIPEVSATFRKLKQTTPPLPLLRVPAGMKARAV